MAEPTLPAGATPVVAVVVVHHVHDTVTRTALESLRASTGVEVDLVVAYNGPGDDLDAVRHLAAGVDARLVECGTNRGFAAAVRQALASSPAATAGQAAVFLLNDDARVEPATVARCLAALDTAGGRCVSVAPLVLHADRPDLVDSLGVVLRPNGEAFNAHAGRRADDLGAEPREILGPCFAAALFRPGAFHLVGPLDDGYFLYYEDVDWNVRAAHRGWHSVAAPDAIVHHHHALSTRRMGEARRYGLVQRNLLLCATANLSWRSVRRIWWGRLVAHAKGLATGPYRGRRLLALAAALVRVPAAIRRRPAHRGAHPVPDEVLFAHSTGMEPRIDTTHYRPEPG